MKNEDIERYYGKQFIQNQRYARVGSFMMKSVASISVGLGGLNFFIATEDRPSSIAVPVLGGVAMLGANRAWRRMVDRLNDTTIMQAIEDWEKEQY